MPRPRSEEAHTKVLEAALALFSRSGIDATSMDAIAAESGVSKATIYKHWPDKDRLAMEVISWLYGLDEEIEMPQIGNLRDDLIAALSYRPDERCEEQRERLIPHLIAYSVRNQVFGIAWRERVRNRHCTYLTQVLRAAIERGEVDPNLEMGTAVALLFGPLMYRQIFVANSRREKASPEFIAQIVESFVQTHARDSRALKSARPAPLRRVR
jgi:AcrR family transcriptional regulator